MSVRKSKLELRLSELLAFKAAEERLPNPSALYLEDLAVTIVYINSRLKAMNEAATMEFKTE